MPYESTRVCLQPIRGVEGSDYINASFIDGYRYLRSAPSAQGSPASRGRRSWTPRWPPGVVAEEDGAWSCVFKGWPLSVMWFRLSFVQQWFSVWAVLPPKGNGAVSGDILLVITGGVRGGRPGCYSAPHSARPRE